LPSRIGKGNGLLTHVKNHPQLLVNLDVSRRPARPEIGIVKQCCGGALFTAKLTPRASAFGAGAHKSHICNAFCAGLRGGSPAGQATLPTKNGVA
jgi:hypothetical protein